MSDSDDEMPPELIPASEVVRAAAPGRAAVEEDEAKEEEAAPAAPAAEDAEPTPVTILTGWLGAGKTTLVRHIVEELGRAGKTMAVINNEAGATGVEEQVRLSAEETMDVVELGNGCVCCSVKNDFLQAVEMLLKRRRFDYVLVECSGVANPGQVASMLWVDAELESNVTLDAVVCVVDAVHLERNLDDRAASSLAEQLAFSDAVLLNKCDLVSAAAGGGDKAAARLAALEARVAAVNGFARVHRTERSRVPLSAVLGLGAYSAGGAAASAAVTERAAAAHATAQAHATAGGGADGAHAGHAHGPGGACNHDDTIVTEVFEQPDGAADLQRLKAWLAEVLWKDEDAVANAVSGSAAAAPAAAAQGMRLFRYKAVLAVRNDPRRHYLQGVQSLFDVDAGPAWAAGERPFSRLVVIGRHLDRAALQAGFSACFAP